MRISGYITKAACRGYRPAKFASHRGRQRPHLIARLAKERGTARFIVAPDGYGKTSLAVDYAETMFMWAHVFWLNAQSPCFLRDLDNGEIASTCLALDSETKLVIVDGLPQLDVQRAQLLSGQIDALLAGGSEVVVTCVPSADLFASLQIDRVRIGAADLLLTDEELDATRTEEERLRTPASDVPASQRVPVLVWDAQAASVASFVSANLGEGLPSDMLLAAAGAFALRQGSIADLISTGPIDTALIAGMLVDYPHFGFDVESGQFEAPAVDIETLARAMKPLLGAIAGRSRFDQVDDLVQAWADALLDEGCGAERACDLMRTLCSVRHRISWLQANARRLARSGEFKAIADLIRSFPAGRYEGKLRVLALEALCYRMLGDEKGAVRCAKRCAFEAGVPNDARAVGLMITARFAPGELSGNASANLATWAHDLEAAGLENLQWHELLVVAWAARQTGAAALGPAWLALRKAGAGSDVLCLAASWLFALVGEQHESDLRFDIAVLDEAEHYVRERLLDNDGHADFFASSAGLSMEAAHAKGLVYRDGPIEAGILLGLRRVEVSVLAQRREFERARRGAQSRHASWTPAKQPYGEKGGNLAQEQQAVPTLEVRLFGRFDLSVGGVPIGTDCFVSKGARVLLVLLVVNRGRDLSRDVAAQAMWPSYSLENARKGFYSAWSRLRKLLTLSDGTCPYLVKHQYGCRLESRYVQSDVARLDDICRELLFGKVDFDAWRDLYTEIDRDFAGDLMPAEEGSDLVAKLRDDQRMRLVDALVTAATRLVDAGNPQWAIWYARAAAERDRTREDAYVALMRAQIAYDQRTAAMMTYLNCRRVLGEDLGIDPSPEMQALYEGLLGS